MLASVQITSLLLDGIYDVVPVEILANRCLRYIHFWMKYIRMVPMYYVTLEFLQNYNLILTRYKFKINITTSMKRTLMVRTILLFSCYSAGQTSGDGQCQYLVAYLSFGVIAGKLHE